MGASVIGILLVLLAVLGLIVWLLISMLGSVTTMVIGFALVCLLMMLIILIQKPRGGGLSGAFGGAGGGSQAAFGAKTGDVLTFATIIFFVCYMALAMGLTWATGPSGPVDEIDVPATQPEQSDDEQTSNGGEQEKPAADVEPDAGPLSDTQPEPEPAKTDEPAETDS